MKKDIVEIRFNAGPVDSDQEIAGTFHFETENVNEAFIVNVLRKSVSKLQLTNQKMIVCVLDVFVNDKQEYEAAIFGTSTILVSDIRKI